MNINNIKEKISAFLNWLSDETKEKFLNWLSDETKEKFKLIWLVLEILILAFYGNIEYGLTWLWEKIGFRLNWVLTEQTSIVLGVAAYLVIIFIIYYFCFSRLSEEKNIFTFIIFFINITILIFFIVASVFFIFNRLPKPMLWADILPSFGLRSQIILVFIFIAIIIIFFCFLFKLTYLWNFLKTPHLYLEACRLFRKWHRLNDFCYNLQQGLKHSKYVRTIYTFVHIFFTIIVRLIHISVMFNVIFFSGDWRLVIYMFPLFFFSTAYRYFNFYFLLLTRHLDVGISSYMLVTQRVTPYEAPGVSDNCVLSQDNKRIFKLLVSNYDFSYTWMAAMFYGNDTRALVEFIGIWVNARTLEARLSRIHKKYLTYISILLLICLCCIWLYAATALFMK